MFPKWFVCVMTFFMVCGFCSEISSSSSSMNRKTSVVFSVLHIILAAYLTYYLVDIKLLMDKNGTQLEMINGMFQYSCALMSHWVVILESYFQRKNQRFFFQLLECIDQHQETNAKKMLRNYRIKFLEYFVFYLYLVINLFEQISNSGAVFAMTLLSALCQARMFYYLFYLETINFELKMIKNKFIKMIKTIKFRKNLCEKRLNDQAAYKTLIRVRKTYQHVYEIIECITKSFGWSNIASIFNVFLQLMTDLNWMCQNIYEGDTNFQVGNNK